MFVSGFVCRIVLIGAWYCCVFGLVILLLLVLCLVLLFPLVFLKCLSRVISVRFLLYAWAVMMRSTAGKGYPFLRRLVSITISSTRTH